MLYTCDMGGYKSLDGPSLGWTGMDYGCLASGAWEFERCAVLVSVDTTMCNDFSLRITDVPRAAVM